MSRTCWRLPPPCWLAWCLPVPARVCWSSTTTAPRQPARRSSTAAAVPGQPTSTWVRCRAGSCSGWAGARRVRWRQRPAGTTRRGATPSIAVCWSPAGRAGVGTAAAHARGERPTGGHAGSAPGPADLYGLTCSGRSVLADLSWPTARGRSGSGPADLYWPTWPAGGTRKEPRHCLFPRGQGWEVRSVVGVGRLGEGVVECVRTR